MTDCSRDQRGWEWNFLNRQCHVEEATLTGHTDQVFSSAWSPDGRWIASASWRQNCANLGCENQRRSPPDRSRRLGLVGAGSNRAGTIIAVASGHFEQPSTVNLYDVAGGQKLHTLLGHSGPLQGLAFSSDDRLLATSDNLGSVKVWDVATGHLFRDLGKIADGTICLAFAPPENLRLVVSIGTLDNFWPEKQGRCLVWDVATWRIERTLHGHEGVISSLAFGPDGKRLATASYDGTIKLWDVESWTERITLRGHTQNLSSVAYSPDGSRLASTSDDGTARLWEPATGKELLVLRGHDGLINHVSFRPDGQRVVTAGADRTLKIWDVTRKPGVLVLDRPETSATDVAFSPDGQFVAVSYLDKTVRLWESVSGRLARTLSGHGLPVWSVAFSPDGNRLASGAGDYHRHDAQGEVVLWETATGRRLSLLVGHKSCVWSVAFSPDGQRLASGGGEIYGGPGELMVWDATSGRLLRGLPTPAKVGVKGVAFSPDSSVLASGDGEKVVRLWDPKTGAIRSVLRGCSGAVFSVAFDPTGQKLLATGSELTMRLWDLTRREIPKPCSVTQIL